MYEVSLFSISWPTFVICRSFWWWSFWQVWGDSALWFWFTFPYDYWCWASFHVLAGYLHFLFGKMSIQFFCSLFNQISLSLYFFFLMFSYMSCWVLILYWPYLQIFSLIHFYFISNFLSCAKAFKFSEVPFVYFLFYFLFWRVTQKKFTTIFTKKNFD